MNVELCLKLSQDLVYKPTVRYPDWVWMVHTFNVNALEAKEGGSVCEAILAYVSSRAAQAT